LLVPIAVFGDEDDIVETALHGTSSRILAGFFTHKSQDTVARKNDFGETIDRSTDFRFWHL
jgi:hypothetical protein